MNKESGFTLIEVMISVMVLAFGLLGLAGLQASGLKNNRVAYNRGQATLFAYDISDRMRANTTAVDKYLSSFMIPANANPALNACATTANPCTPTQLAVKDLYEWNQQLKTLPNGEGTIEKNGVVYNVIIKWDENKNGLVNPADPDDPVFEMRFQI